MKKSTLRDILIILGITAVLFVLWFIMRVLMQESGISLGEMLEADILCALPLLK